MMAAATQPELELSWEDVECFVRPQLVLAKDLRDGLDRELLLLVALHKANGYGGYFRADESSYFKFVDEVAAPLLGTDFQWQYFDSAEEALVALKGQTPAAAPVLVPGNIRELYYYEGYQQKDWAHYFIVDEYVASRDLFRVRDNLQMSLDSRSTEYRPFVIPGNLLFGTMRLFGQSHVAVSGRATRSDQDLDQLDRALTGGDSRTVRFMLMAANQRALYVRILLHALALLSPDRHALAAPQLRKLLGEKNALQTSALVKLHRSGALDIHDRQRLLVKLSDLVADVDRRLLQEAEQALR
jgi:hypothetical protein